MRHDRVREPVHDTASAALVSMLSELKTFGMAQAVVEPADQGAPAFEAAQPVPSKLLKAETAAREVRSVSGLRGNRHLRRENYLFMGSDAGGERAAAKYSPVETAKLNGLHLGCNMRECGRTLPTIPSTASTNC